MLSKTARTDRLEVVGDEGWSLGTEADFFVTYSEGNKRLRVGYTYGETADGKTSFLLSASTWRWEGTRGFLGRILSTQAHSSEWQNEITDLDKRRQILQRVKTALEFLGYPTRTYSLEVLAGLRQMPEDRVCKDDELSVELSEEKLRICIQAKSLTVPVVLLETKQAEVRFGDFQLWDPPHEKEMVGVAQQGLAIHNFTFLLAKRGYTLLVKK